MKDSKTCTHRYSKEMLPSGTIRRCIDCGNPEPKLEYTENPDGSYDIPDNGAKRQVIKVYPYQTASLNSDSPWINRQVLHEIEALIPRHLMTNKTVVIVRDNESIGCGGPFAIWFYDYAAQIGNVGDIKVERR